MKDRMIFRFSLYGFLKNQQYYEPFLILAFLQKGLSFFEIGILVGFRELFVNLLEIPSGAAADLFGRRRCMFLSFSSYILSFIFFALSRTFFHLFPAMLLFSVGEAFRTGTHKAIILHWLRLKERTEEKTKVYGYTRSWSRVGSALSVVVASALIFYTGNYAMIFWLSVFPYVLGLINLLGYPKELEGRKTYSVSLASVMEHLRETLSQTFRAPRMRRILIECMGYEGTLKATKDYLQPTLKSLALGIPIWSAWKGDQRTALIVGLVYVLFHLAGGMASRKSHAFVERFGGIHRASKRLWIITFGVAALLLGGLGFRWLALAVCCFVVMELLMNLWRPVAITRLDDETKATQGATLLSVEAQSKALGAMLLAPVIGLAVDHWGGVPGEPALWAAPAFASLVLLLGAITPTMREKASRTSMSPLQPSGEPHQ